MKLYVGQTQYPRRPEQYAKRFNFAEVRAEPQRLPKLSELSRTRERLTGDFQFAVLLPRVCAALELSPEVEKSLAFAEKVSSCLGASWVILQTQATVFPSDRTRRRLREWAARLKQPERNIGWEPLGVWEPEEAQAWAEELGVHFVTDASRQPLPPVPLRYARIRSLGEATNVRPYALEVLAENLEGSLSASVAFEGDDAARTALALRAILGIGHGGDSPEGDNADEDGEGFEDDGDAERGPLSEDEGD